MFQRITIIGHLGKDPESRYLPNGDPVASFSVATSEKWKDKDSGEKKERTEWWRCSAFGKLAEICGEYLHKGSLVMCEGAIRTKKWTDKDGVERYTPELVVTTMKMLGGRSNDDAGNTDERQPAKAQQKKQQADDDFDDDIPF